MPRLIHLSLLIPVLVGAACAQRESSEATTADRTVAPTTQAPGRAPTTGYAVAPGSQSADETVAAAADTAAGTPGAPPATSPAAPGAVPVPQALTPAMIIRTGTATVEVDRLGPAMARVEQLARRLGGYVANSTVETGDQNIRQASLELKLPAARWNDALAGLAPIGKLESQQTTAEDVGEEYVDVTARMVNARRMEERLLNLLDTRTGKLDDVLAVERELSRVREEIERYEGRLRYLRTRAAVSTLTVRLHEPLPVLAPGRSPILNAFRQAWRHFVDFTAGFIEALGWLIPLLLLFAGAVWVLVRLLGGRRPGGWRDRWTGPVPPQGPRPPQGPPPTQGPPSPQGPPSTAG